MHYKFLAPAQEDLLSSIDWLREEYPDRDIRFVDDVNATIQRILASPKTWQLTDFGLRKLGLSKFPFTINYAIRDDLIVIVSIAHARQNPKYWHSRINIIDDFT